MPLCFAEIVVRLRDILNAVGCLDACFVADETLENLLLATKVGQTKVGGSISINPGCGG